MIISMFYNAQTDWSSKNKNAKIQKIINPQKIKNFCVNGKYWFEYIQNKISFIWNST